jgi:hypothetical protein
LSRPIWSIFPSMLLCEFDVLEEESACLRITPETYIL